jgi:hypothetical protein
VTFKEQIEKDVRDVFANPDEHFDMRTVDGRPMPVMEDDYELFDRRTHVHRAEIPGKTRKLLYIPVADYGPKPAVGRVLLLDGKRQYKIVECDTENGFYVMTVEAYRQYFFLEGWLSCVSGIHLCLKSMVPIMATICSASMSTSILTPWNRPLANTRRKQHPS